MDERAAWDLEMRRVYLTVTDVPCPTCGYNLRGSSGDKCPECAVPIELSIRRPQQPRPWDTVAVIAIVLTTIYFAIHGGWQLVWITTQSGLFSGSGSTFGFVSTWIIGIATAFLTAGIGLAWCIGALVVRKRLVRPAWASPTNAAAGMLLTVFIVFLLSYGLRYLF